MGSGPAIILLHGGGKSSQTLMQLGTALSDEFTVYIPDRRGRGLSGPFGDEYSLKREVEDVDALIKKTGAHYVFGTATGGIIALQSALELPDIHKAVLYEPPFYVNETEMDNFNDIGKRYDEYLAEGKLSSAMVTSGELATKVSDDELQPPYQWVKYMPNIVLRLIFKIVLELDSITVKDDDIKLKDLLPTFHNDVVLVNETKGTIENFKNVSAEVLLLSGSKTFLFLKHSLDALNEVLPHVERVEIQGIDHAASEDKTGKPKIVAQEIKRFLNSITKKENINKT
ncbi:alpha/beta fold hydrolase [Methanobacterium sp.]|uniref:alpha/beta fold hydrolase n=1 Tax=Methanobacterium sp. TaxID=2164 RepID=UPI003C72BA12